MNLLPFVVFGTATAGTLAFFYHYGKKARSAPISYSEFIDELSQQVDQFMISEERKNNMIYYGGECRLSFEENDSDVLHVCITIYGKPALQSDVQNDKWAKSTITRNVSLSEFTADDNTQAILANIRREPVVFKVDRPERNTEL